MQTSGNYPVLTAQEVVSGIKDGDTVQIIVTEQGPADLRGLGPMQRAKVMIEKCAHPAYKEYLERYVKESRVAHIRHDLVKCFELHRNLMEYGSMLPDLDITYKL